MEKNIFEIENVYYEDVTVSFDEDKKCYIQTIIGTNVSVETKRSSISIAKLESALRKAKLDYLRSQPLKKCLRCGKEISLTSKRISYYILMNTKFCCNSCQLKWNYEKNYSKKYHAKKKDGKIKKFKTNEERMLHNIKMVKESGLSYGHYFARKYMGENEKYLNFNVR